MPDQLDAVGHYKDLLVWQKSHALAVDAVPVARGIRGAAFAPLRSQIIRAAMSIPTNLVEGAVDKTSSDYRRFVRYSIGSAAELEYHLRIAVDVRATNNNDFHRLNNQLTEVRMMLFGLSAALGRLSPE